MELNQLTPFIRYANTLRFTMKRGPSRTYDSRMLYTEDGSAVFRIQGKEYRMKRGDFVLFQSGYEYMILPSPEIRLTVIDFDLTEDFRAHTDFLTPCPTQRFIEADAHPRIRIDDVPRLNEPLYLENAVFLEAMIRSILLEFREKRMRFREMSSVYFKELLTELTRNLETGRDEKGLIRRVFAYADEHYREHITNEMIGEALFYNPNYLNRLMLRETGMTLHRYVLERRLASAKELLFTTKQPIGEIAVQLGFHSASHFSNFFRKETGMTPDSFRRGGAL